MLDFEPLHVAWLRYVTALGAFLLIFARKNVKFFIIPKRGKDFLLLFVLGFFPFCFAPILQMQGLALSRASDNALIIGVEPLITVLLAWIFLREKVAIKQFFALGLAVIGIYLLSADLSFSFTGHFLGNILIFTSIIGEGFYSIAARKLTRHFSVAAIFGSALFVGVFLLSIYIFLQAGFPKLAQFHWASFAAILWMGPLSTTLGYLYWMQLISRGVAIPSLVITLFLQPVLGAIWGILLLHESLALVQGMGMALIFFAILSQFRYRKG